MHLSANIRTDLLLAYKEYAQSNLLKVQAYYNNIAVSDQESIAMGTPSNAELKNTTEVDLAIGSDGSNFIVNKLKIYGSVASGTWAEISEVELESAKGEVKDFTADGGGIYRIRTLILSM